MIFHWNFHQNISINFHCIAANGNVVRLTSSIFIVSQAVNGKWSFKQNEETIQKMKGRLSLKKYWKFYCIRTTPDYINFRKISIKTNSIPHPTQEPILSVLPSDQNEKSHKSRVCGFRILYISHLTGQLFLSQLHPPRQGPKPSYHEIYLCFRIWAVLYMKIEIKFYIFGKIS